MQGIFEISDFYCCLDVEKWSENADFYRQNDKYRRIWEVTCGAKLKCDVCRRIKKPICRHLHKILLTFCRARHANVQECQLNVHAHTLGQQIISCTSTLKSNESKHNGGWNNSQPGFKQRQETAAPTLWPPSCCTPSD